jgi:RND superfamily putative drug exporter
MSRVESPENPESASTSRSRWIVGLFVAIAAISGLYGMGVKSELKAGGLVDERGESTYARQALHEALGVSQPDIVALFTSDKFNATDSDYFDEIEPILDDLADDPSVESVHSFFDTGQLSMISHDGSRAAVFISLRGDDTQKSAALARVRSIAESSSLKVQLGGTLPAEVYAQTTAFEDLAQAELLVLPLIVVLLFLFFRGFTAMLLPIAVALFAIATSLAALRLLTHGMDVSVFALNIASFIGIGLAVDYSLLIVTRFREELGLGKSVEDAARRTMETAGRSILISGLTVAASLAALLIFPLVILRTIGISGILVVFCAMIGALVLLPELLRLCGTRVGSIDPRTPSRFGARMKAAARVFMKRPVSTTVLTMLGLALLGAPVLRMKSVMPDVQVFPIESEVRQVDNLLESKDGFGGVSLIPIMLAVRAPAPYASGDRVAALIDYTNRLKKLPGIDRVLSPFGQGRLTDPKIAKEVLADPSKRTSDEAKLLDETLHGDLALIYAYGVEPWRSNAAADLIEQIRALPAPGLKVLVGGATAENLDGRSALIDGLPLATGILLATNIVVLFLAFGSVVLPFKAIAMNIVSLSASFGALVWIFQDGHLHHLLRFDPPGGIDVTVPVVLLAIVFGLSMDYEIFLLSRIKEEFDRSGDNRGSVALGLERTSSIITRAAVLLIAVVVGFAFGELIFVKEIGVGMAIAIAIDASIVRCILVPSTMELLGDLNWWAPKFLRRIWNPSAIEG